MGEISKISTLMQDELNCMILEYQSQLNQLKIERLKHVLMDQYYVSSTTSMSPSHKYTILHKSMKNYYTIIK